MERFHRIVDAVRHELWPLPAVGIGLGLVLGFVLPAVDGRLPGARTWLSDWVFGGSAEAARSILGTISGSVVTVTTLTFSLTLVVLQLASSQYTPRLLRKFTGDHVVHGTLAVFLGTFAYSLGVLRTVRNERAGEAAFVPGISVTVAFLLAVVVVVQLVVFLSHVATSIRLETILQDVAEEGRAALRRAYRGSRPADPSFPQAHPAAAIPASGTGFVTEVDAASIASAASGGGWTVEMTVSPGDFITAGQTVGLVRRAETAHRLTGDETAAAAGSLNGAIALGRERTALQDPLFPVQQMVDISNRALSPGVNDSTTALHCLHYLGSVLTAAAALDVRDDHQYDDGGTLRVVTPRPAFREIAGLMVHDAVAFGRDHVHILCKVFDLLHEAALCDTANRYSSDFHELIDDLVAALDPADRTPRDAERIRRAVTGAREAAVGRHDLLAGDVAERTGDA
ncbi:DUF2254 domain-containing protein [Zhihengliuella sp.]|uniref:DUF2254 domain-containing protein n=1 Tax=Zhihengliuella sp. TaxID=1954483 RepID=UPI0028110976|nr:DUF2254 domain-containing protein [Zhihengliuella sp.]